MGRTFFSTPEDETEEEAEVEGDGEGPPPAARFFRALEPPPLLPPLPLLPLSDDGGVRRCFKSRTCSRALSGGVDEEASFFFSQGRERERAADTQTIARLLSAARPPPRAPRLTTRVGIVESKLCFALPGWLVGSLVGWLVGCCLVGLPACRSVNRSDDEWKCLALCQLVLHVIDNS